MITLLLKGKSILLDNEDYPIVNSFKWYLRQGPHTFYARGYLYRKNGKSIRVYMHRLIMNVNKGQEIDHIDGNGLNNQKSNLRICSHAQNAWNQKPCKNKTSIYKGVYWHKQSLKWRARIRPSKKHLSLGLFNNEMEAALAYDRKAKEIFGKFARVNLIPQKGEICP